MREMKQRISWEQTSKQLHEGPLHYFNAKPAVDFLKARFRVLSIKSHIQTK